MTAELLREKIRTQEAGGEPERAAVMDVNTVAELASELWPEHTMEEMTAEFQTLMTENNKMLFLHNIAD